LIGCLLMKTELANMEESTFWGNISSPEFAKLAKEKDCLVIQPTVGLKDWSNDLPLDVEEIVATELLKRAVLKVKSDVPLITLPPLRFLLGPKKSSFFSLDADALLDLFLDVIKGVRSAGFKRLLLFNSSPDNHAFLDVAAREARIKFNMQTFYLSLTNLDIDQTENRDCKFLALGKFLVGQNEKTKDLLEDSVNKLADLLTEVGQYPHLKSQT